ncbi:peroxisomal membrane protein PEX13 [Anabrus simplex]|uniref:peroxisomal membrane protein PEX13 n=1 Tax=Anabrus simplex TaxID=316456 RepID=UPI0034DCDBBD
MTAPPKPWEVAANRLFDGNTTLSSTSDVLQIGLNPPPLPVRQIRTVPPLPPRPHRVGIPRPPGSSPYFSSLYHSGYGSNYSGYGGYGSYGGGYGSYGGFGGYGMNQYGFSRVNNAESRFIQMAEEGSRPAFQSIESIVQAFCSVSFMMESTFNAMYSSFRAVLGVAENFGQLRSLFGQFLSVFAIFRWFRWMVRKGLYLLGLQGANPIFPSAEGGADSPKKPLSWPVIFFLAIVFTGPYLMWKLLNSLNIPSIDPMNPSDWRKCKKPVYSATVLYDFTAASDQELSLQAGQRILIAPKELQPRGPGTWLLATRGKKVGLIPANYIRIVGCAILPGEKSEQKVNQTVESCQEQPSVPQQNNPPQEEYPILEDVVSHIPGPDGDKAEFCKATEVPQVPNDAAQKSG